MANDTKVTPDKTDYTDVTGWRWKEVVEKMGMDYNRFLHLYQFHPDMLTKEGYHRKLEDNRFKFTSEYVIFDKDFVVEKLVRQFEQCNAYNDEKIDDIMQEVKLKLEEEHKKYEQECIQEIQKLARELGLSPEALKEKIKVAG